jgi:hypothetical protein
MGGVVGGWEGKDSNEEKILSIREVKEMRGSDIKSSEKAV